MCVCMCSVSGNLVQSILRNTCSRRMCVIKRVRVNNVHLRACVTQIYCMNHYRPTKYKLFIR